MKPGWRVLAGAAAAVVGWTLGLCAWTLVAADGPTLDLGPSIALDAPEPSATGSAQSVEPAPLPGVDVPAPDLSPPAAPSAQTDVPPEVRLEASGRETSELDGPTATAPAQPLASEPAVTSEPTTTPAPPAAPTPTPTPTAQRPTAQRPVSRPTATRPTTTPSAPTNPAPQPTSSPTGSPLLVGRPSAAPVGVDVPDDHDAGCWDRPPHGSDGHDSHDRRDGRGTRDGRDGYGSDQHGFGSDRHEHDDRRTTGDRR